MYTCTPVPINLSIVEDLRQLHAQHVVQYVFPQAHTGNSAFLRPPDILSKIFCM